MAEETNNWIEILSGSAWALGLDVPAELIGHTADEVFASIDPELAKRFAPADILVAGSFGAGTTDARQVRALLDLGIGAIVANEIDPTFATHARACGFRAARIGEALAIRTGDQLRVDFEGARIANQSTGDRYPIRNADDNTLKELRTSLSRANA